MSSSELSLLCEIEEEEIIEQMAFWQKKGVVHVTIEDVGMNELGSQTKIYEVIEYQQANAMADSNDAGGTESELTDRLSAASEKQHKATLLEIEKYVLGKRIFDTLIFGTTISCLHTIYVDRNFGY